MTPDDNQTKPASPEFDYSSFPENTLFYDRRSGRERRHRGDAGEAGAGGPRLREVPDRREDAGDRRSETGDRRAAAGDRREKKERRRRIDPTTFEKQYTDDEMEFMNAMQRFKELSGKAFPSYGEVLKIAIMLGYRRAVFEFDGPAEGSQDFDPAIILASVEHN